MKIVYSFLITLFILAASPAIFSCTAFYLIDGEKIIVGNNEDYFNPNTRMWFIPGAGSRYGAVYFGFEDGHSQGGMNEEGLFYDGFWVAPEEHTKTDPEMDCPRELFDSILKKCATVEEALVVIEKHKLHICTNGKLMYGDATGDAVIIGNGAITQIEGNYLISTNFFENRVKVNGVTCKRYLKAEEMIKSTENYTPELAGSILQTTTAEFTQYSIIYDLKNRKFTLFHFKNFEIFREYDLEEELKKGEKHYNIPDLFPYNEAFHKKYYSKITPGNSQWMRIFMKILLVVFLFLPIVFGFLRIFSRGVNNGEMTFLNFSQILLTLASIISFGLTLAFAIFPSVFILGLPGDMDNLTMVQKIFVNFPLLLCILVGIMIPMQTVIAWSKPWVKNLRFMFSLSFVLFGTLLGLIFYWGLFKIYL